MDSTFDNFDFQTSSSDVPFDIDFKIPDASTRRSQKFRDNRDNNRPKTQLKIQIPADDIWIGGTRDKTVKRIKELESLGDDDGVVQIRLKDPSSLSKQIPLLKTKLADFLNGKLQFPVGNSRNHKKCHFKIACEKGFDGDHGFSHPPSSWIMWELFRHIYVANKRSQFATTQEDDEVEDDAWDAEEDDGVNKGYYRHQHPKSLPFDVEVRPRANNSDEKLAKMFGETIPAFFAGRRSLPRIGRPSKDHPVRWCQGPFCYRTLLATNSRDAITACKSCHSDETSLITSIARVLVECNKTSRVYQNTTPVAKSAREPRAPRPATRRIPVKDNAPIVARNTFNALLDEEGEKDTA